jgi:hypothetical protein
VALLRQRGRAFARSSVPPTRQTLVLGGFPDREREPACGGYAQVAAPRLCDPGGGLASSNIPLTLRTRRYGGAQRVLLDEYRKVLTPSVSDRCAPTVMRDGCSPADVRHLGQVSKETARGDLLACRREQRRPAPVANAFPS